MKNLPRFLFLCTTFFLFPFAVFAQPARELIERFDVSASVNADSSVDITEQITVRSAGDKIRRGIFRVLPYKGVSGYEILFVQRDGRPEPYSVQSSSAGKTVYIGDKNRVLAPGLYKYEIAYRVSGAVRFQKKFDEFYWNVTGNEWQFPIQSASLRLTLPQGADIVPDGISLYTGYAGQSSPASARAQGDSFFFTTRPLNAGEGFTVSAAWNKGIVKKPKDWMLLWFVVAWIILIIYYVIVWKRVGKDPAARVIRRFEPPEGLSPAQVRYLCGMGAFGSTFSVIIMSLLQKGCVRVNKDADGDFTLVRKDFPAGTPLSAEEAVCLEKLFTSKTKLPVNNNQADIFRKASSASSKTLESWAGSRFFSWNLAYNIPTLLFAFLIIIKGLNPEFFPLAFIAGICIMVPGCIVTALVAKFFPRAASFIFCFGLIVLILIVFGLWTGLMLMAVLIPGVIFWWLVRAYTPLGREKMDEIEGFLQYLQVAEEQRVFASNPTDAARIYCNYLPYAVALGVQNKWWNALERELGSAAARQIAKEQDGIINAAEFAAFSAALGAASVTRESSSSSSSGCSSSGFGGGGCSGGGSGGGGGGGW